MTTSISGTGGVTFNDNSVQNTAAKTGMVNKIINGAMVIDQRNAGASVTLSGAENRFPVDRLPSFASIGTITAQQSSTAPDGFTNSVIYTVTSPATVSGSDNIRCAQNIEGYNIADLGWGTATAKTITLSFWVRSSLTGTFSGALRNSANDRSYIFSYTISSANTFEYKTITIVGDTTGTWLTTNGVGIRLFWSLGAGATVSGTAGSWQAGSYLAVTGTTSVVGTSGATFYITGVQLEKGSTATSFDYRPYGTELMLCQRYYWKSYNQSVVPGASGVNQAGALMTYVYAAGNTPRCTMPFKVNMRTAPTITLYNPETGTAGYGAYEGSGATNQVALGTTFTSDYATLVYSTSAGFVGALYWQTTGSAEL